MEREGCVGCEDKSNDSSSLSSSSSSSSSSILTPEIPAYKKDLWAHLSRIKSESFSNSTPGAKRKLVDVMKAFSNLNIDDPLDDVTTSLKKLKLGQVLPRVDGSEEGSLPATSLIKDKDPSRCSFGNGRPEPSSNLPPKISKPVHAVTPPSEHAQ